MGIAETGSLVYPNVYPGQSMHKKAGFIEGPYLAQGLRGLSKNSPSILIVDKGLSPNHLCILLTHLA